MSESSKCHSLKVKIHGENNIIDFRGVSSSSAVYVDGSNNNLYFEEKSVLVHTKIIVIGDNLKLKINSETSFGGNNVVVLMGSGKHISIGKDCMIATNSEIWASDSHPIYKVSEPSVIINESGNIDIGDHVWVGRNVYILKNVKIGDNSVIGMASVVTHDIPKCSIAVGNPAKVVNESISWNRNHIKF